MSAFIQQHGGLLPALLVLVVCFNIAISGIKQILEAITPAAELQTQGFYKALGKILEVLKAVTDWVSANVSHK